MFFGFQFPIRGDKLQHQFFFALRLDDRNLYKTLRFGIETYPLHAGTIQIRQLYDNPDQRRK